MFTFLICHDTKEEISCYEEYLNSEHWKRLKQNYIDSYGNDCKMCGDSGSDLHHISYARLGNENLEDVILLCRNCHYEEHFDEIGKDV